MKISLQKYFYLVIVIFATHFAFAQDENCELTLSRAAEEFQAGHFYAIPSILSSCINKFTVEQQQRAHILLTQTYLLLDDPIGARNSFLQVLKANPEFVADEKVHPIDIVYLSKKFTASPIFGWFGTAGMNTTQVNVLRDIDVFNGAVEKYRLRPGFQFSAGGDLYITERIGIRGELSYLQMAYQHNTTNYFEEDTKVFSERMSWLCAPVTVVYADQKGKYRPYGYLGYSHSYLAGDVANAIIDKVGTAEQSNDRRESPEWDYAFKRNKWNGAVLAGAGIKFKIGLDFVFVDLRYSAGLRNVVRRSNLYVNNEVSPTSNEFISSAESSFSFAHVDDFFKVDNISLSFGFLRPLYKPRELKKAKTKSVFRKINKTTE